MDQLENKYVQQITTNMDRLENKYVQQITTNMDQLENKYVQQITTIMDRLKNKYVQQIATNMNRLENKYFQQITTNMDRLENNGAAGRPPSSLGLPTRSQSNRGLTRFPDKKQKNKLPIIFIFRYLKDGYGWTVSKSKKATEASASIQHFS